MKDNTEGSRQMKKAGGTDSVPYKFLTRLDNRMPLRYRKLWFQLTCPQGRIRIIVHSHTEDAASCTAEVYLDKKDSKPVSACTAACSRKEAENFLKAAENRALTGALIQAGFTRPERLTPVHAPKDPPLPGPVSPASNQTIDRLPQPFSKKAEKGTTSQKQEKSIVIEKDTPVQPAQPAPTVDEMTDSFQTVGATDPIPFPGSGKASAASAGAQPSGKTPEQKAPRQAEPRQKADPVTGISDRAGEPEELLSQAPDRKAEVPQPQAIQMPYNSSTPVEEIKKYMTLEDALHTYVEVGACKGMTLEKVGRERFPFLRWYVYGYRGNDNILRAAAQIVWDSFQEENKAG